jgi:adenine deaminase
MVRHSSIRTDLEELGPAINALPNDSIILVSDGIFADDLMFRGYMDHIVGEAVRFGVEPQNAIRMATINPARYFRVDSEVGSLTPGRIADVLLLESLDRPVPVKVFERGTLAAEAGTLTRRPSPELEVGVEFYPYAFSSVDAAEFVVERPGVETVPVIDIVDRTVTRRMDVALPRAGNIILADRKGDVRKIVYSRREQKKWGQGFLHGFGADCGGIASTVAHETHGLLVHGFNDDDMALAANTVLAMKGGIAVVDAGKVLHALRLPLGAIMSRVPLPELDRALRKLVDLLHSLGNTLDDPLWTMGFLPFTSIVELRITVSGTYDVRKGSIVF